MVECELKDAELAQQKRFCACALYMTMHIILGVSFISERNQMQANKKPKSRQFSKEFSHFQNGVRKLQFNSSITRAKIKNETQPIDIDIYKYVLKCIGCSPAKMRIILLCKNS